jgi:dipeptide/tripeptide permease
VLAPTLTGILSAKYGYSSMFIATAVATMIGVLAMSQVRPGVGPRVSTRARQFATKV